MPFSRPCVPCHGGGGGGGGGGSDDPLVAGPESAGMFDSMFSFFQNLLGGGTTVAMTETPPDAAFHLQGDFATADMGLMAPVLLIGAAIWVAQRNRVGR